MLEESSLEHLKNSKSLLAFSAGVDSTALLFLLLEHDIKFDIAIIDYGLREQSKMEVSYAQKLSRNYDFECHILVAEEIASNFEAKARAIRYDFFEELINTHNYDTLLTAHHLGDRLEWMLMQFCKGAGCVELAGMKKSEKRKNYTLLRPLLHLDKSELLTYLEAKGIEYFIDSSNNDKKYTRNEFRHDYANPMLEKYLSGIKKSFAYIDADRETLIEEPEITQINAFAIFKSTKNRRSDIVAIDKYLKSKGQLITAHERELLSSHATVILGRKIVLTQELGYIFISPYLREIEMPKSFKEKMRILKIEPKLRPYFFTDSEAVEFVSSLLR
jgi:tRNA(Ile)-lysidine synthase